MLESMSSNISACSNVTSKIAPFSSKFFALDFFHMDQDFITTTLKTYPRMRDFHSGPPTYAPVVHMARILASTINATLIGKPNLMKDATCANDKGYLIFPTASVGAPDAVVLQIHKDLQVGPEFSFLMENSLGFNYAYCGHPETPDMARSPFALFHETADNYFCLALLVSFVIMTIFFRLFAKHGATLQEIIIALLCTLFSGGFCGARIFSNSFVFTLWMGMCVVCGTYFGGALTSFVVSPNPEPRMTEMGQLIARNYSLVSSDPQTLGFAKAMIESIVHLDDLEGMEILKLLTSSWIPPTINEFLKILTGDKKIATISSGQLAIYAANLGTEFILTEKIPNMRCYIGRNLVYYKTFFFLFTSPVYRDADHFARVLQKMMEGSIHQFWFKECMEIGLAPRVQDRAKVKSPTKIVEEKEDPRPLKVEGNLQNAFFLWVFCIVISSVGFFVEGWWYHFKDVAKLHKRKINLVS